MEKLDFNRGWQYRHLNTQEPWIPVTLPHDAMLHEPRGPENLSGKNGAWFEGHDYLYQKPFTLEEAYAGKSIVFEFESVYHDAEITINGHKAASRPYGYTSIYVQADGLLQFGGENVIEVVARNADQPNSRWYSGAGIYRPVHMYVLEEKHIKLNGVKIHTTSLEPPEIAVSVQTNAPGSLLVEILDGDETLARQTAATTGEAKLQIPLPGAQSWAPESPKLYTCRVTFGGDVASESFGVRTLGWDAQSGFTLNGERVILRGACIHHDNGMLGAITDPDAEARRVRILQQNGYNAIRSAHNPCSKALLDACDRLGMLVMDEYTDMWYIHKTRYDYALHMADWWQRDLADMVDKDYNHPCVILYSTGNEVSETAQPRGIELTGAMTEYLHGLDASRPVTCGVNIFFNFLSSIGFGVYSDSKAEKEIAAAGKKKKAVGSEFYNNIAGLLGSKFMKFGATLHGSDVKTRDAFARMDMAGYNYGIDRYKKDLQKYPERLILGTETFCSDAARFLRLAGENPRIVGDFVWSGMDYIGETGVGSWEYEDYAPKGADEAGWMTAGSGRIDLLGRPLGEAAYTRVVMGAQQAPAIAVRPVNHTGERHTPSAWKMTNAMESWAWHGCEGKDAVVEVYANGAWAELFVNGASVGKRDIKDCRAIFKTTWQPGEVSVVVHDAAGREVGQSALQSGGPETELRAIPEQKTVQPGGLCYVLLQYTDGTGLKKPLERGKIQLEVEGGELLAAGHACPYNPDGYLNSWTDTYYGEAMAIIRATQPGTIRLKATDGKLEATAEIPCVG